MSEENWEEEWFNEGEDYITYDEYYNLYRSRGAYGYSDIGRHWAPLIQDIIAQRCETQLTPERERIIIDMYLNGEPLSEIELKAGVERRCIYFVLQKHNIRVRRVKRRKKIVTKLTPKEKNIIEELYKQGMSISEIARIIGRNPAAVWKHLINAKLHSPRQNAVARQRKWRRPAGGIKELEKKILELYKQGVPVAKIREETGASFNLIYRVVNEHGLQRRARKGRRAVTEEEKKKILELYKQGMSISKIAKIMNRNISTIRSVIKKYGQEKEEKEEEQEPA